MNTEKKHSSASRVLMIYTGGTIGMIENPENGVLEAFDFDYLEQHVPEIGLLGFSLDVISMTPAKDSSDMGPEAWLEIATIIQEHYEGYDGFVVLHGTDTMSYTASALSFMLHNLTKPVVLTGSQLPIGRLRTDGKENLITALEIAAAKDAQGRAYIHEVCVLFNDLLMRGNRSIKSKSDRFNAFESPNYPPLAHIGIDIHYDLTTRRQAEVQGPFSISRALDRNVVVLKLFPGISREVVRSVLSIEGLRGVVLETFGSGNAPRDQWFLGALREAIESGVVVVNVTQCLCGSVEMKRYETGFGLADVGVISGYDSTTEAALAKLMYLLGQGLSTEEVKARMVCNLRGEVSIYASGSCSTHVTHAVVDTESNHTHSLY